MEARGQPTKQQAGPNNTMKEDETLLTNPGPFSSAHSILDPVFSPTCLECKDGGPQKSLRNADWITTTEADSAEVAGSTHDSVSIEVGISCV